MATKSTVIVTTHDDEIDRLVASDDVHDMLFALSQPVVADARGRAPKATGRGARSIHSEMILTNEQWQAVISWDQFHYYMYFSEEGTKQRPPHAFLVPALRRAAH